MDLVGHYSLGRHSDAPTIGGYSTDRHGPFAIPVGAILKFVTVLLARRVATRAFTARQVSTQAMTARQVSTQTMTARQVLTRVANARRVLTRIFRARTSREC